MFYTPDQVVSLQYDFEKMSMICNSSKESIRDLMPYFAEAFLADLVYTLDGISPILFTRSTAKAIDQLLLYLNRNFTSPLTLQSVADTFGVTKDYCNRVFKQASGMTIMQYVIYNRVLYAKKLLSEGVSAAESSQRAGFSDYSNFYRSYCRITGNRLRDDRQLAQSI